MRQTGDFYPGNRRRAMGVRIAQLPSFESRNRYGPLSFGHENSDVSLSGINSYKSSKRPASSPAYDETLSKKYNGTGYGSIHETSSHDNSVTEMQIGQHAENGTVLINQDIQADSV